VTQPRRLVLLRHGESEWNALGRFTGWADVGLTEDGTEEAVQAGELVRARGLLPDVAHTSLLRRTISTAELFLDACDRQWIPVRRSWRLNGRHYGALQGADKAETLRRFGRDQFLRWRRSYSAAPPDLDDERAAAQAADPRYAGLPPDALPRTESLRDTTARLLPYWCDVLVPEVRGGHLVVVISHGNLLRALVKHLDRLTEPELAVLDLPTGIPILYQLDRDLRPLRRGGEYLDPARAAASIEAVRRQGTIVPETRSAPG
jgi:2,3-bisphosphoglycerate-dependent phosphoglycerate mutase